MAWYKSAMKMLKKAHSFERRLAAERSEAASEAVAAKPKLVSCKAMSKVKDGQDSMQAFVGDLLIKLKYNIAVSVPR